MNTVFIYALCEPDTGELRYIGKAKNVARRFKGHLEHCNRSNSHKDCWIRSLVFRGQKPILEVLDEVAAEFWQQWEAAYIQFFREEGSDLVNATAGGEGVEMTPEICAKLRAAMTGKSPSVETRAKLSVAGAGRKHSEETRAKIGEKALGRKQSEETRAKLSAAMTGKKPSDEARAKMSVAGLGRKQSKETCAKKSVAMSGENNPNFGKHPSDEARKKMSLARIGMKQSAETIAKRTGKQHSPETIAKMSAVRKQYWEQKRNNAPRAT